MSSIYAIMESLNEHIACSVLTKFTKFHKVKEAIWSLEHLRRARLFGWWEHISPVCWWVTWLCIGGNHGQSHWNNGVSMCGVCIDAVLIFRRVRWTMRYSKWCATTCIYKLRLYIQGLTRRGNENLLRSASACGYARYVYSHSHPLLVLVSACS